WEEWEGAANAVTVLAGDAGDAGYARYVIERDWRADGPANALYVGSVMGTTPAATAALWRHLLELDLVVSWSWFHAPVFDPLPLLADDLRRVQRAIGDGLWVRLVDVPAALSARAYATDLDCVVEVADEFCPWNAGVWHLDAGGCTRAAAGARSDLTLTSTALASAYLGGVTVADLVRAGHATARSDEVAHRLSTAFSWPTPPWAVTWI
ncbi:MAG TPA: sterol carrier protein domain-containing protein, partial [Acidimicrobiales bacterium]